MIHIQEKSIISTLIMLDYMNIPLSFETSLKRESN